MKDLLLLHGALGSKEQLNYLESALSAKYKIHNLSFSGHGSRPSHHHAFTIQNFAHEVLDWMNSHYLQTINIFGYSMGGYVALWLARFYPERVSRIFTLGTKLNWSEKEAEKEISMLNPDKIIEKVPAFAQALAVRHGEHEWRSVMLKTAAMMKDLAHTHLTAQDFVQIEQPVMLARGDNDRMVTHEETDSVHRLIKNSQLKTFENTEHAIEKVSSLALQAECELFFK